jgi:glycosyltransferase involved in cell wall biosynthesis
MYHGLQALLREHDLDVVEMPECGAEGALITTRLEVPTVVRLHSPARLIMPYYDVPRADVRLCSIIEQRALDHATALTGCSSFVAREAARELHIQRPISVIPNGLDISWLEAAEDRDVHTAFALPRRRLMIVFAGRMERRKGIHLCLEIASSILERFDVTFVLAGQDLFGYVQETLLPRLASRPLRGSIHWLGAVGNAEMRPLVRAADIFLLPSLWENCPYACLEAMATGRAVVGADQGGMPELIQHGVNGLLATPNDAQSFTRCIETLIEDKSLRARLGSAARESVRNTYSHTRVAHLALGVYKGLVSRPDGTAP